MNAEAIREVLRKQPFEPFEILTSGGEVHRVMHPDCALVSATRLVLLDPVADRLSVLALIHVAEIRMRSATVAS